MVFERGDSIRSVEVFESVSRGTFRTLEAVESARVEAEFAEADAARMALGKARPARRRVIDRASATLTRENRRLITFAKFSPH
jgi:hypothetical protein